MLNVLRAIFVILSALIGWSIGAHYKDPVRGLLIGLAVSASVLMLGILVGFVLSHFVIGAIYLVPYLREVIHSPEEPLLRVYVEFSLTFFFSFISVIAILHTKDEFKFVIPFVDLKREGRFGRAVILDTSVIIDGRIADIMETRVLDARIIVPRFVLAELQQVADSADRTKRARGRRGLDILGRMQKSGRSHIEIEEVTLPQVEGVDAKLVHMAKLIDARVITNDLNLNKVAQVQGVEVININDLANAMRSQVLQGEHLTIKVLKQGQSAGQGVGYLEDGTMVVAEECSDRIGQEVELVVTNVLQTSAGRLIFGRPSG